MQKLLERVLLTWRLTSLCVNESGPFDMFEHFRDVIGIELDEFSRAYGSNIFAKAFTCFWCASIWVGLGVAIIYRENPLKALAYSAGAICIERFYKTKWAEHQPTRSSALTNGLKS